MCKRILKNTSAISIIFLTLIIPLIALCREWIRELATIRVASGISYYAITIGVALWFFWLGLKVGERRVSRLAKTVPKGLIFLSVLAYLIHVVFFFIGKIDLFGRLQSCLGYYFAEMSVYRFPLLLYGVVFLVLGILMYGNRLELSGRKGWVYCGFSAALYLACCIGAELVYDGLDNYHACYALIHAISVFPLVGLVLSVYSLSGKDYKIQKCKGLADFLAYLCPSAIFIYVLKLYSSPILVLLYLVGMWFVYRKFARK